MKRVFTAGIMTLLILFSLVSTALAWELERPNIRSTVTDEQAFFDVIDDPDYMALGNLTKRKVADGSNLCGALFEAVGINQPEECSLELKPLWWFFDQNNVDHWVTITLEINYSGGAINRQVNIPIRLEVKSS